MKNSLCHRPVGGQVQGFVPAHSVTYISFMYAYVYPVKTSVFVVLVRFIV